MSTRHRSVRSLIAALALGFSPACVLAGPRDISTNFPVGIVVGDTEVAGIADTGGTTTISYEDAKKLGILDENGDPKDPPDGSTRIGGTGGASVSCHRYDKLKIKVQPKNADGTNNGDAKEIECTVLIPKKPSEQTGADDAEKARKTASVTNKLGKNVTGADIAGSRLEEVDKKTKDPKKNERSTKWATVVEDRSEVPFNEDPSDQDDIELPCSTPTVYLNGVPMPANVSTASASLMPQWLAGQIGASPAGTEFLSVATQQLLYSEGLWPMLPQPNPVPVQVVLVEVVLPTLNGPPITNSGPALFITAPFIQQTLIGSNALIPEDWSADFNSDTGTIQFARLCLADFDGSGFMDTDDFDAFIRAFEEGSDSADFDRSGFTDTDDFDAFVHAFEVGC